MTLAESIDSLHAAPMSRSQTATAAAAPSASTPSLLLSSMEYSTHTRDRVMLGYRTAEVVCQTPGSARTLHIVLEVSAWSLGDPERERLQIVAHGPFRSTLAAQQACLGLRGCKPTHLADPIEVRMVPL